MTLPYYEVHDGNGPHLLMVHGILSSRAQWLPNIEALKAVCKPVILELFGHGRSTSPTDDQVYRPDGYIAAFETIRSTLGIDSWMTLGYSLGAGLTLRYGLTHPTRIDAQCFTNSISAFRDESSNREFTDNAAATIRHYDNEGMAAINKIPVHPRYAKRLDERTKTALLEDADQLSPAGVARTIVYTNGYASVRSIVHNNTVPALLLCGTYEKRFHASRQYACQNMPHLDVIDLPAGHAVNAEAPQIFNKAMIEFIGKHTPPNGQQHAKSSQYSTTYTP
jgi:pimeloyl-ACP methyl ester carboxylesterase